MTQSSAAETKSHQIYKDALKVLPGGVSRNTVYRKPHPFYVDYGEGAYLYDIEGEKRIDFANNMASLIHGHAYRPVVQAVSDQLQKGSAFTMATEVEVRFAELLCDRVPSFGKIRFVNSGTEGVMSCIKAARAFTGKEKMAKVEGAYHGAYDYAEVSQISQPDVWGQADSPNSTPVVNGTPKSVLDDVIVLPFNDSERAIQRLNQFKGQIACVLLDPMPHRVGLVPASNEFVCDLHRWCVENGALLVFDEVITFRSNYAGAQQWFDVKPDLTAIGKMIGGGFPVGAIAGRSDVMDVMDPSSENLLYPHSGTFSANPISMTAGYVAMQHFDQVAVEKLNDLTNLAKRTIESKIEKVGIPACVSGGGSMIRVHLKPCVPTTYREAFLDKKETKVLKRLLDELYRRGLMMINTCSFTFSTVMGDEEIEVLGQAMEESLRTIKDAF